MYCYHSLDHVIWVQSLLKLVVSYATAPATLTFGAVNLYCSINVMLKSVLKSLFHDILCVLGTAKLNRTEFPNNIAFETL
jgi:hypothetical protein